MRVLYQVYSTSASGEALWADAPRASVKGTTRRSRDIVR